ncbi:conjugal transfer protein [Blautia coccoides]|nr:MULTISPECIES: conjugal transfer protein [Bacillota]
MKCLQQTGGTVKASMSVKIIDSQTKATQISQYELTLYKNDNWMIIK